MKKENPMKLFIVALMTLLMLLSCTPEDETVNTSPVTIAGDGTYTVTGGLITLTDLEINGLYAIFPQYNSRNVLRSASGNLFSTNGGTYLHFAEDDEFTFNPDDIGLSGGGSFRFVTLEPEEEGTKIEIRNDETGDKPLFTNEAGQAVYEEYYRVNLDQYVIDKNEIDKNEVAIMILKAGGGGNVDTDYGIFLPGHSSSFKERKSKGVMDLSDYTDVYLYNQVHIGEVRNDSYTRELRLMNPVDLILDEEVSLKSPGIYRVKTDGLDPESEYVIEITRPEHVDFNHYLMSTGTMDPRTVYGYHRPYVFPISYGPDSIIVYIGKPVEELNNSDDAVEADNKDFIFNFQMSNGTDGGKAMLREITADEKEDIEEYVWNVDVNPEKMEIQIPGEGEGIIPIIMKGDEKLRRGKTLELGIDGYSGNGIQLRILCSHVPNGAGYSQSGLFSNGDRTYEIDSNSCLEYMFLWYKGIKAGENPVITLSLT